MFRIFRSQPLLSMTKRITSATFPLEPSSDPVPTALSLYVALSPSQFNQLETDQPITPDPYSERFGLREDRLKALERAHYLTNWTPPHASGDAPEPIHQKQFVLCKILITPLGYMTPCEEGTLRKGDGRDYLRDGHYQWYGLLYKKRSTTTSPKDSWQLLWVIEDKYEMVS